MIATKIIAIRHVEEDDPFQEILDLESMTMSVLNLRVFSTADSEFVIDNLLKLKGKPEINTREKSTLFLRFFTFWTWSPNN